MAEKEPVAEQMLNADERPQPSWAEVRDRLAAARTYWLATVRPDGRPHAVPLLAVWLDGALYFVAGETTRKARDLARNAGCAIATSVPSLDLVVEGEAAKVCDEAARLSAAAAYADKYEWPVTVRDGAFHADGAPTAGPPPYDLYWVTPTLAFSFGTDETFGATRWRF